MDTQAYSVSQLTRLIKGRLEEDYREVWVEGEVTNYRGPAASGHRYFALKDEGAQVKAVLFKNSAARGLKFELKEGQQVLAFGRISVYEPRGEYQLVAEKLEPRGLGALQMAFEQLKRRLEAEGLFDPARKRPLPEFPRRVVVVTSPTGAVIRDILHVTSRRCAWIDLLVLPVRVQGEGAAQEIAAAIRYASNHLKDQADLVLLARGGGSLEDLWAFNEEPVARAIFDCSLPVLSAVGHEVDFTIADFVADVRAPTPSAAAEMLSPSRDEIQARLSEMEGRLGQALKFKLSQAKDWLEALAARLRRCHPKALLEARAQLLDELSQSLAFGMRRLLASKQEALALQAGRLNALSPLAVLERGYAACFDASGRLVRAAAQVSVGQTVNVRLGKGSLDSVVKSVHSS